MIKIILYSLSFYILTCIFGYPVYAVTLTEKTKKYSFIILPMTGVSCGMIIMYYINLLEVSVNAMTLLLTGLFICVDFLLYLVSRKRKLNYRNYTKYKSIVNWFIISIIILIVSTAVFAAPGLNNNNGNLPIIIANNDFALYTATSNAVKYGGETLVNAISGTSSLWVYGFQPRFVDYWIAYISCLFNLNIFDSAYIFMIYAFSMIAISIGSLVFYLSKRQSLGIIGAVVSLFNCNFHYILYEGFIGQLLSIAYFSTITLILFMMLKCSKYNWKLSVSAGVILAGLSSSYSEMIPIIVAPIALYIIIQIIRERKLTFILYNSLTVAATMAVVFFHGFYTVYAMLIYSDTVTVGWDITRGYLPQALGIYNVHYINITWDYHLPELLLIILSCLLLISFVYFIIRKFEGEIRILFLTLICSYSCFYVVFVVRYDLYKSFKGLVNMSYIFIVLSVLIVSSLIKTVKHNKIFSVLGVLVFLLIAHNGVETYLVDYAYSEAITEDAHLSGNAITDDHMELTDFFDHTEYKSIYYAGQPYWDAIVALGSGLQEGIATNDLNSFLWNSQIEMPENAILVSMSACPDPISIAGDILLRNEVYTVKSIDTTYPFCVNREEFSSMFVGLEGEYFVGKRRLKSKRVGMDFCVSDDCIRTLDIELSCSSENIATVITPSEKTYNFKLIQGENNIHIEDISFKADKTNCIFIEFENADDISISELAFDNFKELPKTSLAFVNYDKYKWITYKSLFEGIKKVFTLPKYISPEGETISFGKDGNWTDYVNRESLQGEEGTGHWSFGTVDLTFGMRTKSTIVISFDAWTYQKDYRIHYFCNGEDLGLLSFDPYNKINSIIIPDSVVQTGNNNISFWIEEMTSPYKLGESQDTRDLGIFFEKIYISLFEEGQTVNVATGYISPEGETISFGKDGNWTDYVNRESLQGEEGTGQWSFGTVDLTFGMRTKSTIVISFDAWTYQKDYKIHYFCNGEDLGLLSFDPYNKINSIIIPDSVVQTGNNNISFWIEEMTSPYKLGESQDTRDLGIFFEKIYISLFEEGQKVI